MTYFYDEITDTIRRFGHLSAGPDVGERFSKTTKDWVSECCKRSGCRWDKEVTEEEAQVVIERNMRL